MLSSWEPPIGIEPMTYALRGARDLAAHALAAPIAPIIALMALTALGISGDPVHEPVHARSPCSLCSGRFGWQCCDFYPALEFFCLPARCPGVPRHVVTTFSTTVFKGAPPARQA